MKLYGSPTCPYSRRVRYALELADIPYEHVEVPWEQGVPAWYQQLQPSGTVPLLVDGAHSYGESDDAIRYLDRKLGLGLVSGGPDEDRRAAWITSGLLQRAARQAEIDDDLARVEHWFGAGPYLGGDTPGYLDVVLSSVVASDAYGVEVKAATPRLARWRTAMRNSLPFQRVAETYGSAGA